MIFLRDLLSNLSAISLTKPTMKTTNAPSNSLQLMEPSSSLLQSGDKNNYLHDREQRTESDQKGPRNGSGLPKLDSQRSPFETPRRQRLRKVLEDPKKEIFRSPPRKNISKLKDSGATFQKILSQYRKGQLHDDVSSESESSDEEDHLI